MKMQPITRFCNAVRKPVDIAIFAFLMLNLVAKDSIRTLLHHWRIPLVALMTLCVAVQIINNRTRKHLSKETAHA